jgi:hypothetical protein
VHRLPRPDQVLGQPATVVPGPLDPPPAGLRRRPKGGAPAVQVRPAAAAVRPAPAAEFPPGVVQGHGRVHRLVRVHSERDHAHSPSCGASRRPRRPRRRPPVQAVPPGATRLSRVAGARLRLGPSPMRSAPGGSAGGRHVLIRARSHADYGSTHPTAPSGRVQRADYQKRFQIAPPRGVRAVSPEGGRADPGRCGSQPPPSGGGGRGIGVPAFPIAGAAAGMAPLRRALRRCPESVPGTASARTRAVGGALDGARWRG